MRLQTSLVIRLGFGKHYFSQYVWEVLVERVGTYLDAVASADGKVLFCFALHLLLFGVLTCYNVIMLCSVSMTVDLTASVSVECASAPIHPTCKLCT